MKDFLAATNPFPFLRVWEWDEDWPLNLFFAYICACIWLLMPLWLPIVVLIWLYDEAARLRCRHWGHSWKLYVPYSLVQMYFTHKHEYCRWCREVRNARD